MTSKNTFLRVLFAAALLLIVAAAAGPPAPAYAATNFIVNSSGDGGDSNTADGVCNDGSGNCTLRAAIQQVNAGAITGAPYSIAFTHSVTLIQPASALPTITRPVTIDGNGIVALDGVNVTTGIKVGLQLHADASGSTITGMIIAGWAGSGIVVEGSNNWIHGNRVGIKADETTAGSTYGVALIGSDNILGTNGDGTDDASERNIISGNYTGVLFLNASSTGNRVAGNYIGTDSTGLLARPNFNGVEVSSDAGAGNVIGANGDASAGEAGEGNVIAGNLQHGLYLDGAGTIVAGNTIGLGADGITALPNNIGVEARAACTIGGSAATDRNVISGNTLGLNIWVGADGTVVQGNWIGVDAVGNPAPNVNGGISLGAFSANTLGVQIGGVNPGEGNVIAKNGSHGITVQTGSTLIVVEGNAIRDNGGLGIDLQPPSGVTANDAGDADTGANNLQNFPVLTFAYSAPTGIDGTLDSTASTDFRLHFYSNQTCDPGGYGEGATYIGYTDVTTDASGQAAFSAVFSASVPEDYYITATATGPDGTSEFSECVEVEENLLLNGGMETDANADKVPDGWKIKSPSGKSKLKCDNPIKNKYYAHTGTCAVVLASTGAKEVLQQTYTPIAGAAGDAFTLRVWASGKSIPSNATARAVVLFKYTDGTKEKLILNLPTGDYAYQQLLFDVTAAKDYTSIKVKIEYAASGGKLSIDDVSLVQTN